MGITRDDVLHDRIRQRLKQELAQGQPHILLSDEEFDRSRAQILEAFADIDELWVFGYGSLIWSPTFEYVDQAVAQLPAHARSFCLWAPSGRGTPEQKGLWLALDDADPAIECSGVAFRIDDEVRDHETLMLWRREMVSGAYLPKIRQARIEGRTRPCLCLLANKAHPRYAGHLPQSRIVEAIATAEGNLGTCREYLFNLVDKLHSLSVHDPELDELTVQVREYRMRNRLGPD